MIKQHVSSPKGMSKDLASQKQSDKYFDAKNIRILATDQKSTFAITNEAGTEQVFSIPTPYISTGTTSIDYEVNGNTKSLVYEALTATIPRCPIEVQYDGKTSQAQVIIGTKEMRDSALIVSTDGNGWDCFWELVGLDNGNFDLNLLYISNLSLSKENLIQILYNYENSIIQKIYFVDGVHQLRFFNIRQSKVNGDSIDLVNLDPSSIDVVSKFKLSQPEITGLIGGGSHTSGVIQYSYGLYILNGSQTSTSPLSELISIDKGSNLGGGDVNEVLGKSVNISIPLIDDKFTHIKIYSIKWTSYNQLPEIKIVADKEIDSFTSLKFTDDGLTGTSISLEAYTFLGSNPIIPRHIATKDNRLFPINIVEQPFDVELDCRAFAFNSSAVCDVIDSPYLNQYGTLKYLSKTRVTSPNFAIDENRDSINANYNEFKYQSNGSTLGASGKYISVQLVQGSVSDSDSKQFFKDRELYRIGIKFYNRLGQTSEAKWIMDFVAPEGNLAGNYNQLKVTLTSEFTTWANDSSNFETEDEIPVGYKIIRADRTLTDQTIYAQGFINPMIANVATLDHITNRSKIIEVVDSTDSDILPSMVRMFEDMSPMNKCIDYRQLASIQGSNPATGYGTNIEGFKSAPRDDWRADSFQHNRLMQFFSPDVLFRDNQIDASFKLRVLGLVEQSDVANWSSGTNPLTGQDSSETKFSGGLTVSTPGVTYQEMTGEARWNSDMGFFGPTNGANTHARQQVYREFLGPFRPASTAKEYEIYGTPEVAETGSGLKAYNNNYDLRYSNNLKTMLMDDWRYDDDVHNDAEVHVKGVNSNGARCITFAEGSDDLNFPIGSRKSIETIHQEANTGYTKGVLLAEFVRDHNQLYVGGMYGGMSYEAKKNAVYIEIGSYNDISNNSITIESPGDTFVNTFTFTKIAKDDVEIQSTDYNLLTEIVSIRVETTVDLKNRNDLSIGPWDNRKHPRFSEYQNYNKVYSQQANISKSLSIGAKVKKIQEFDGRLMSSKEKIPGEFIDSWTDFLENEKMDLDGKYGPINAVVNMNDEIFCLQDSAVAHIAVNPRAQVQAADGISLELGTGGILHDYSYKSTTSGCLNKWGAIASEKGIYYVDVINSAIMGLNGEGITRLSDVKGFHHELLNTMNGEELRNDNPVNSFGVSTGFNSVNSDVYFSFHQSSNSFTLGFNEKVGEFVSYYGYVPSWYINKGSVMISTSPEDTQLWEHFKGLPNHFYGVHHPSSITVHVAPAGNEIILNGASYKMELRDSAGNEVPSKGLTGVRVYNDYQDSGLVPLVNRENVFKKFRNYKVNFPRDNGSRDRVRGAWGFAEFEFDNTGGNKLILHDISIFFTQH